MCYRIHCPLEPVGLHIYMKPPILAVNREEEEEEEEQTGRNDRCGVQPKNIRAGFSHVNTKNR